MMELADIRDLKSLVRKDVPVRVRLPVPELRYKKSGRLAQLVRAPR